MINAISKSSRKILGTFTYGWEELGYYTKWLHGDKELAKKLKGPALELGGIQSEYSEILLEKFKELIEDENYRERLKEHYHLFKKRLREIRDEDLCLCGSSKQWQDCCAKLHDKLGAFAEDEHDIPIKPNLGRNDPCHCGSGKKYKKCCCSRDEGLNNPLEK
ncbi:SEC-C domain-containing protein [Candidatus Peregrinibacteria bacterium]|nr:SEC-C domain-containing protein [Candidatus Peregrinibacteria bacterium]